MAGLVKLNDPAGELSANYALQRQQQKKDVYVAIGAAEFRIWDAIRASKQAEQQPETKKRWRKGVEEEVEKDGEEEEEKALA